MTVDNELYEAARALLPFLADDDELSPIQHLKRFVSETPAQRMRREADEIDAKDRAIARLRAAVAAYEEARRDGSLAGSWRA